MCTLACWVGVHPRAPLVVAANRDERLGRPARGPFLWPGQPRLIAPRDELAGGTWWAVNEHGLFVALTNRAGASVDDTRRSRGQLVLDIARCRTLDEAAGALEHLPATAYNGFHLFASDGRAAVQAIDDARTLTLSRLGAGFWLLTESGFGARPLSRDAHARSVIAGEPNLAMLRERLAQHSSNAYASMCIHLPGIDYGTRSATVLALGGVEPDELWFSDGPPCATPWQDLSTLFRGVTAPR
jgi:uncharacterized protein with NRDE domain